ncbi:MAG: recombinase family protein [Burkholderia multivorans]|nr:recombinase family protein [Burkholderia multivorans]
MATYGYTRVSAIDQADGTSLEEQARKINAIADFRGEKVERIFVDAGVSGSTALEQRPEGKKLAKALKKGDVLICAKLDRAFRDAADALEKMKTWKQAGIKLILTDMGTEPVTENGVSKLMFTILAGFAEWERERILERINDGRRAKRAKGGFVGGSAPFGFRVVGQGRDAMLEPDPATYPALETIYECADAGLSLRKIAEIVQMKHACTLSYQAVRRILKDRESERTVEVSRPARRGRAAHV